VTYFLWQRLQSILSTRHLKEVFCREAERLHFDPMLSAANAAFKDAIAFYRARRGKGETAMDVSTFFRRKGLHREFELFWRNAPSKTRSQFTRSWKKFRKELFDAAHSQ
jgi:hypothetical protein